MKKSLTILAMACTLTGAYAQDLTSKKGEQILPEEKDWSIGVDATPFLNYMGNFFGKTANNNSPTFDFLNSNQAITGKYFVEAQTAYRASLRIGLGSVTERAMVTDRVAAATQTSATYPTAAGTVENKWKRSNTNVAITAGIEKRKGKTRLQGYYGAELGFGIASTKDKFEYGNAIAPTATPAIIVTNADNFSGANNVVNISGSVPGALNLGRVTERKNGSAFSFGVRAFVGVEYFILPKISLGGEFGWGIALTSAGKTSTTYESVGNRGGTNVDEVGTSTIEGAKNGSFSLDTDNNNSLFGPAGSLRLNFHF